jgi:hypothetical protein
MGTNYLYLNPVPDQAYVSDWDCVVTPVPLALDTTPEVLPVAMQTPVPYYAAHVAKYNEQSYEESEIFYKKYWEELRASAWAVTSTRTRDAYRR